MYIKRDPKRYCVFTSNYPFIDNDGYTALCCKNSHHKLPYHIKEHKLSDIWRSPEMLAVREQFAKGENVEGCFKCYDPESKGIRSFRTKMLGQLNFKDGRIPFLDDEIRALDLRIGNICNLSCTMCYSGNSNRIYQQIPKMAEHFGWSQSRVDDELEKYHARNYDWSNDERAWDNIISAIDKNLQHCYLAGGEPFYLKNFASTVKRIGSIAPNARFVINTNGTRLLREKDLKQYEGLKVGIRLSVDGWGLSDEWTRQETVWEEKLAVMDQYYKEFNLRVFDITANAFSVRSIPKLIKYLEERYPLSQIQVRPVINKQEILMENLPDRFKAESLAFFEDAFKNHPGSGLDHVISEMKKPFKEGNHRKEVVKQFVEYYDKNGTVKLEDFDPELAEYVYG